jgi:hypothetical protein
MKTLLRVDVDDVDDDNDLPRHLVLTMSTSTLNLFKHISVTINSSECAADISRPEIMKLDARLSLNALNDVNSSHQLLAKLG